MVGMHQHLRVLVVFVFLQHLSVAEKGVDGPCRLDIMCVSGSLDSEWLAKILLDRLCTQLQRKSIAIGFFLIIAANTCNWLSSKFTPVFRETEEYVCVL